MDIKIARLELATVRNSRIGSWSRSNPEPDRCNRFYHTKTWTVAIGPVLPPKTWHFNLTTLAPIKYLSSDHIVPWSIRTLCGMSRSSTSRFQICETTNICWVGIENTRISHHIMRYFTVIQQISVASQISMWEVKRGANTAQSTYWSRHDMIRTQKLSPSQSLATVVGTAKWNHSPVSARPKTRGFMSRLGNNPALVI